MIRAVLFFAITLACTPAAADEVNCAVATNFVGCLKRIAAVFEDSTGHTLVLSPGSTGAQYAQIRQGAPFDVFFAADTERPIQLEKFGFVIQGSRTTYAMGQLALWVPGVSAWENSELRDILNDPEVKTLAVADPVLAPFGRAAQQVFEALDIDVKDRLVIGRSVGQAWHFVASGGTDAGLIALSQVFTDFTRTGLVVTIDPALYSPIEQQVVILSHGDSQGARALLAFVTGPEGRSIIKAQGYGLPDLKVEP